MELDDRKLGLLAKSVSITIDSLDRKVQRLPEALKGEAANELDEYEMLLRDIRDEQRTRRASA